MNFLSKILSLSDVMCISSNFHIFCILSLFFISYWQQEIHFLCIVYNIGVYNTWYITRYIIISCIYIIIDGIVYGFTADSTDRCLFSLPERWAPSSQDSFEKYPAASVMEYPVLRVCNPYPPRVSHSGIVRVKAGQPEPDGRYNV